MPRTRHAELLGAGAAISAEDETRRLFHRQHLAMQMALEAVHYTAHHEAARDAIREYLRVMVEQEAEAATPEGTE